MSSSGHPPTPMSMAERHQTHEELLRMTERLVADYQGVVAAGTVVRCIAHCREQLLATGVRRGLVEATEAAARVRLARAVPAHQSA